MLSEQAGKRKQPETGHEEMAGGRARVVKKSKRMTRIMREAESDRPRVRLADSTMQWIRYFVKFADSMIPLIDGLTKTCSDAYTYLIHYFPWFKKARQSSLAWMADRVHDEERFWGRETHITEFELKHPPHMGLRNTVLALRHGIN